LEVIAFWGYRDAFLATAPFVPVFGLCAAGKCLAEKFKMYEFRCRLDLLCVGHISQSMPLLPRSNWHEYIPLIDEVYCALLEGVHGYSCDTVHFRFVNR
jgi:hypothetical protein